MKPFRTLCVAVALTFAASGVGAQEPASSADTQRLDIKNLFRNVCGFCHEDYGRKQGKGPQLMNNPNTDAFLFNRIKKGSPQKGMASFSWLSDEQITEMHGLALWT